MRICRTAVGGVALAAAVLSLSSCRRHEESIESLSRPVTLDTSAPAGPAGAASAGRVLTVFNHGTDFHRDKDPNELITTLSNSMKGSEARIVLTGRPTPEAPLPFRLESPNPSYVICEGPGSDEVSAADSVSGVRHAHPGQDNPILGTEKTAGEAHKLNPALEPKGRKKYWLVGERQTSEFQDSFMGQTPETYQLTGRIFGNGWDDNVYKVVWLVQHLKWDENMPIDTVNIVGWSRGAVTSLKMANKLFEVFEDTIRVNIVSIDPVPGGLTRETLDTKTIPPNVHDYLAVLALDDDRSNFQPLDRSKVKLMAPRSQLGKSGNPDSLDPTHLVARAHFLPMPGNHSDLVQSGLSSPHVQRSAELTRHIAWSFLAAHGTEMTASFDDRRDQVCRSYSELLENRDLIAAAASGGSFDAVGGYRKERSVRAHRTDYVGESATYLNEHHRALCGGRRADACGEPERAFRPEAWTEWNEIRTLDLPREQACLSRMVFPAK